jgi:phosphatidate cytidylyltransferase
VALLVSLLGAGELLAMFRKLGHQPLSWVVYYGAAITVLAVCIPQILAMTMQASIQVGSLGWLAIGLAAAWILAVVGELLRFESPGRATTDLAVSWLAIFYAGGLMGFLVLLRLMRLPGTGADWGMFAMATFIATVKMSDTGQYTAGRLWGKHKLAPRVSPGKTWEGAVGGVVAAAGTSACLVFWRPDIADLNNRGELVVRAILCGALLAIAGMIGDLSESLLKRDAGVKDSSTWMAGFGGVLDLLDSLLGAAPVAYALWVFGAYGP